MKSIYFFLVFIGSTLFFLVAAPFPGAFNPSAWGSEWSKKWDGHPNGPENGSATSQEVETLFQESLQNTDYERNKANLERIIHLAPDSAYGHFSKGWFWAQDENYSMAVEEYLIALKLRPTFGEARNNLASAYFHLGKWEDSIQEYEETLKQYPNWSETYLNLGSAHYKAGHHYASIQSWEKGLQVNSSLVLAHYYLGLAFDKLGRKGEARLHYREFLDAKKDEETFSEYTNHASERQGDLWIEEGRDRI